MTDERIQTERAAPSTRRQWLRAGLSAPLVWQAPVVTAVLLPGHARATAPPPGLSAVAVARASAGAVTTASGDVVSALSQFTIVGCVFAIPAGRTIRGIFAARDGNTTSALGSVAATLNANGQFEMTVTVPGGVVVNTDTFDLIEIEARFSGYVLNRAVLFRREFSSALTGAPVLPLLC